MTLSEDFAICPWCGCEDSAWPKYYTSEIIQIKDITCENCEKRYRAILRVSIIKFPVHESAKAHFGEFNEHPVNNFETRKLTHKKRGW